MISATAGRELGRSELQQLGLSSSLQGADWITSAVRQIADRAPARIVIVVDAVRTLGQVRELRKAAAGTWRVLHVHLSGEGAEFAARHAALGGDLDGTWDQVMDSPAEAAVHELELEADVVIDTTRSVPTDVAVRVAARIDHTWLPAGRYVDVLVGGQWGNEGKGNPRRVAEFSWAQLRNSAYLNGATDIALTFADYIDARNRKARRFSQLTAETVGFVNEMESVAGVPVSLISAGFDGRGQRLFRACRETFTSVYRRAQRGSAVHRRQLSTAT